MKDKYLSLIRRIVKVLGIRDWIEAAKAHIFKCETRVPDNSSGPTKRTFPIHPNSTIRTPTTAYIDRQHAQTRHVQRTIGLEVHHGPASAALKGAVVGTVEQDRQIHLRVRQRLADQRVRLRTGKGVLAPRDRRPVRRSAQRTARARVRRDDRARVGGDGVVGQDDGEDVGVQGAGVAGAEGGGFAGGWQGDGEEAVAGEGDEGADVVHDELEAGG